MVFLGVETICIVWNWFIMNIISMISSVDDILCHYSLEKI